MSASSLKLSRTTGLACGFTLQQKRPHNETAYLMEIRGFEPLTF